MTMFIHEVTLHLRGEPLLDENGDPVENRHGEPVYSDPRDEASPAWWEITTSDEDLERGEQSTKRYELYLPEGAPASHMDEVTLHGVIDERCRLVGNTLHQPGGEAVEGFVMVTVENVKEGRS